MNASTTRRIASIMRGEAHKRGLSTAAVARLAGGSYESTRRKLAGQGAMTVPELIAYSEALGLDPADVLAAARDRESVA